MHCMVASSIPCKSSPCADRAHARAGDSHVSSAIDVACPTTQSVFGIASPHELHGDSWPSSSTGTSSFCCNQQYSVTAVTTSAGAVTERYAYIAYGQPTILDASASVLSSSAINNRYTYTGREWDATLGLHHFRARWMSGLTGRFLTRDPIGFRGSPRNLYKAFFSVSGMDPSGWTCISNCEDQCSQIYPHWYQWHLFAGCVAGCTSGCNNQPFTLCNYVKFNMTDRYKDGIGCLCGVIELLDLTLPPNPYIATADCVCEVLTGIINSCDSGSWGIFPVHIADCAIDIAGASGIGGLEWYDRLMVALQEGYAWGNANTKSCVGSCKDYIGI
jgi:RHS repeat-associated protein